MRTASSTATLHPRKTERTPYAFTRTETGSVVYATKTESPIVSTLEIALEPGRCVGSMSGELRGFKAHVTKDGLELSGCAVSGVPHGEFGNAPLDELNRFTGAYPHTVRLWSDPVIQERLEALLGTKLKTFLDVALPAEVVTMLGSLEKP